MLVENMGQNSFSSEKIDPLQNTCSFAAAKMAHNFTHPVVGPTEPARTDGSLSNESKRSILWRAHLPDRVSVIHWLTKRFMLVAILRPSVHLQKNLKHKTR